MTAVAAADFHNARVFFSQPYHNAPCGLRAGLADNLLHFGFIFGLPLHKLPPCCFLVVTVLHAVTAAANAIKNETIVPVRRHSKWAYRICPTLTF